MALWIPESTPPQLEAEVRENIEVMVLERGLRETYGEALPLFQQHQPHLRAFMRTSILEPQEILRPAWQLRTAAVIASYAYAESGYLHTVSDDTVIYGELAAVDEGIPDAFVVSLHEDLELQKLITFLGCSVEMVAETTDNPLDALAVGAGCVRHFLEMEVAA